ncbi:hypothetical protein [Polynucleobacter sp. AP-Nino-20-G2]|uniref:hypothetical protein n=1 Tax=Polynucleobacter sp. AP-Nino-20-G2 TaxID=2576917 RepID=UPI001BFD3CDF|nr:hypothetical protein [Polynucleobacter sp. AP-Nino-20-G2]QWE16219.1 hypothetical protein FD960_08000 [Polynucleobacter sp. AP-Nino-20-G2]
MNKQIISTILLACALCSWLPLVNAAEELTPIPKASDAWRFEVTPYLWLTGIKGTMNFDNSLAKSADYSSGNVLSNLKSGGMIAAEAHNGNWGVMGDLISATLQHSGAIPVQGRGVTLGDKITLQQTVLTGAATYTVANTKDAYVDALLGVRAIDITATLNGNLEGTSISRTISNKTSTVDPIVGAKGRYRIADTSWYIPAYADIGSGGGTTNLTWQVMAGVGKSFGSLIDASLTYRALYYDMKSGGVLQKTTMQGPQAAITFKF